MCAAKQLVQSQPVVQKILPSYRLESKNPFSKDKCETVIKRCMEIAFDSYVYNSVEAGEMCNTIAANVMNKIKAFKFDRYRFVCIVTIGDKHMQEINMKMQSLFDVEKDCYVNYVYDTPSFFAIGTVFAVYYE